MTLAKPHLEDCCLIPGNLVTRPMREGQHRHRLMVQARSSPMRGTEMSEVQVVGVAIDSAGQRVIMLKPRDEPPGQGKLLPIWIGEQEATSILVAVEGLQMPRPLAHDLMRAAIDALGGRVDRVEISSIENGTFYAVVYLDGADGEHVIDARPSDAIALASRAGAPLFVAEDVLENAGIEDTITTPPGEAGELNEEHRLEEFRSFLDTVNPEDFGE